ncbi:Hypothetical_protein [Hexamita inflata]|uniref:Hypothetical_protein n=1 Tax=Hexamita inflata TaxID=28002 RepID=A0AA86RJS9_9EUKA|nr:Hypothetical protein HINF_LOCUS63416 [Hexamita inflata]
MLQASERKAKSKFPDMRLGQIKDRSRIGMANGMPSTSLQDRKAAGWTTLHCFLRNADSTTQVDSRMNRLARSSRVTPLDACTRVVGYFGGGSAPNLHRCKLMIIRVNLQFLYRRPNQYNRKLNEWDIYLLLKMQQES